jgi:hypothetical protein
MNVQRVRNISVTSVMLPYMDMASASPMKDANFTISMAFAVIMAMANFQAFGPRNKNRIEIEALTL